MESNKIWKCVTCGAILQSRRLLYAHVHEAHPERCKPAKQYGWKCKYCGCIFKSRSDMFSHHRSCVEKSKLPRDSMGRTIDLEAQGRSAATVRRKFESGELKHRGCPHSPSWRAKMASIMREKKGIMEVQCNFNESACRFIDRLNAQKGWNLQHALNGGEIRIGPYSLDGYDRDRNIAFEYDEDCTRHNSKNGKLKDRCRQAFIIEKTGCEFWRYSERDDLLYRVDPEENMRIIEKEFEEKRASR